MAVKDWNGFRHTQNASIALFHGGDLSRAPAITGNSGTLYASPYVGPGGLLSAVGIGIGAATSGHFVRVALYTANSGPACYPRTLFSDVGCISAQSVGLATVAAPVTLSDNTLYWRVVWLSGAGAFAVSGTGVGRYPVFGYELADGASDGGIIVPYTGDILTAGFPTTFPHSGRTVEAVNRPTCYLSYSGAV